MLSPDARNYLAQGCGDSARFVQDGPRHRAAVQELLGLGLLGWTEKGPEPFACSYLRVTDSGRAYHAAHSGS